MSMTAIEEHDAVAPKSVPPGQVVSPLDGAPQPPVRGRRVNTNRSWPPSPSTTADYPRFDPPQRMAEPPAPLIELMPEVPAQAVTPAVLDESATHAPTESQTLEPRDSDPDDLRQTALAESLASRRRRIAYMALAVITLLGLLELIALSAS